MNIVAIRQFAGGGTTWNRHGSDIPGAWLMGRTLRSGIARLDVQGFRGTVFASAMQYRRQLEHGWLLHRPLPDRIRRHLQSLTCSGMHGGAFTKGAVDHALGIRLEAISLGSWQAPGNGFISGANNRSSRRKADGTLLNALHRSRRPRPMSWSPGRFPAGCRNAIWNRPTHLPVSAGSQGHDPFQPRK